eukprot:COSAG01_NODE_6191_length_3802_cov_3.617607_1_plen_178_part_00
MCAALPRVGGWHCWHCIRSTQLCSGASAAWVQPRYLRAEPRRCARAPRRRLANQTPNQGVASIEIESRTLKYAATILSHMQPTTLKYFLYIMSYEPAHSMCMSNAQYVRTVTPTSCSASCTQLRALCVVQSEARGGGVILYIWEIADLGRFGGGGCCHVVPRIPKVADSAPSQTIVT